MADIATLQYNWRNFSADKGKAKRELVLEEERVEDEIRQAREGIIEKKRKFEDDWREKKLALKAQLDEGVKDEIRKGRSVQEILRELGSNNTVWAYGLRAEVMAEQEAAPKKAIEPPKEPETGEESEDEPTPDAAIEGIRWCHHDHKGVHGWLLSEDRNYVKKYGGEGTPHAGKWFMASSDGESFVAGDRPLFDKTSKKELSTRVQMLNQLLDGEYPIAKLNLAPNKWTD